MEHWQLYIFVDFDLKRPEYLLDEEFIMNLIKQKNNNTAMIFIAYLPER